jgi:Acetoacetate decarboxylase (ADC)
MTYPPPPWRLQGRAFLSLHILETERVRAFIPAELNIISIWPGKTIGAVVVASYGVGSVLEYDELIVAPALVHYAGNFGGWISHIYVDHPDSVAGGREIWGLPKQLAQFTWEETRQERVTITQGKQVLCTLNYGQPYVLWQQPLLGNSFGGLNSRLLFFEAKAKAHLSVVNTELEMPQGSPLIPLELGSPWLTFSLETLNLKVDTPRVVG